MKARCQRAVAYELGRPLRDGEADTFNARVVEGLRQLAKNPERWNSLSREGRLRAVGDAAMRDIPDAMQAKVRAQTDALIAEREGVEAEINALIEAYAPDAVGHPSARDGGFTLNQEGRRGDGQTTVRGATRFQVDRNERVERAIVRLTEAANFSTFLHEAGHIFLEILGDMAKAPNAPADVKSMWAETLDWMGIDGEALPAIGTPQHELWARTFEAYLREGKAPTTALQRMFDTFRKWFTKIYETVSLNHKLDRQIIGVFDRLFASDAELAAARATQGASPALFNTAEEAGMSADEWASYLQKKDDAEAEARAALTAVAMDAYYRQQTAWWNRQLGEKRALAAREIDSDPVRRVHDWIAFGRWRGEEAKPGEDADGEAASRWGFTDPPADLAPMAFNLAAVRDDYGVAMLNALPAQVRPIDEARVDELVEAAKRVRRAGSERTKPRRLASFVVQRGGIADPGGDVLKILGSHRRRPGLINNASGRSLDDMALIAWEAGYFGAKPAKGAAVLDQGPLPDARPTPRQLLDAIADDVRGEAVYKVDDLSEVWERESDLEWAQWFDQRRIDVTLKMADLRAAIRTAIAGDGQGPNAAHPDVIAATFRRVSQNERAAARDLASGETMLKALAKLPPRRQAIEARAHDMVREDYGDPYEDVQAMEDEARAAAHRAAQARVIELELEALDRATQGNRRALSRAAKKFAAERIEQMTVRQIKAHERILGQERKHARLSAAAFRNGDLVTASLEKQAQLVAFHTYALARDAAKAIEVAENLFRSFNSKHTRAAIRKEELDQIDALLEQFELKRITVQRGDARLPLSEYVRMRRERDGSDHRIMVDERLYGDTEVRAFATLTWDRAQGLRDTIKNIAHLGRMEEKMLIEREQARIGDIASAITARVEQAGPVDKRVRQGFEPTELEKKDDMLRQYHAEHMKPEFMFRLLDGLEDNGPTWRNLFRPIAEAEAAELEMGQLAAARLEQIFSAYSAKERANLFRRPTVVPKIGRPMTKAQLLALALNTGNEYNLRVMMEGYQWNEEQIRAALDQLDKRDMDVVQAIWDWIGEYKKPRFDLHERMTGVRPQAVEATPVRTNFGVYRGGYYPIKYDPNQNEKTFQRDQKVTTLEDFGGNFVRPATKQGALKERQGSGGQTVRLDLNVLQEHMAETIHDLSHREAVIDTLRLIENQEIQRAIIGAVGREGYRQLRPWLASIAREPRQPQTVLERTLTRLRGNVSVVAMGWKVTTAIVQPLGILGAVPRLGVKDISDQVVKFWGRPDRVPLAMEFIFERSAMMRHRMGTYDRDVRDALTSVRGRAAGDIVPDNVRRTFFWMTGVIDLGVSGTVWMAAYEKARDGRIDNVDASDEAGAIQFADSVVRMTQGSGSVKDQSAMLRQPGFMRLFTMFQTYFSTLYNQMFAEQMPGLQMKQIGPAAFFVNMVALWFLPAVLAEILQGRGGADDDESDEDYAKRIATIVATYPMMGAVGLRDLVQGAFGDYGYEMSPVGGALDTVASFAKDAAEGDIQEERFIKEGFLTAGYLFGLPARQAWITFDYVKDVAGGDENPIEEPGRIWSEGLMRDTDRAR